MVRFWGRALLSARKRDSAAGAELAVDAVAADMCEIRAERERDRRGLLLAISASLHLFDLLVLGADVAEDLQFRGSRGGQASDWPRFAPCFAVI